MQKWKTAISGRKNGELYIRGEKHLEMIQNKSFVETVFLLWRGKFPSKNEEKLFNAMLVSAAEHGIEVPSTFVSRTVASCGTPFSTALAAGILSTGEWHGGAVEKTAMLLASEKVPKDIVREALARKERVSGFGHKVYKEEDPRARELFRSAKKLKIFGKFAKKSLEVEKELARQSGKKIPLNIDGALAALLLELKFDWRLGKALFVLARIAGISAHVWEEMTNEKPYRRLSEEDVEYCGPVLKKMK